MCQWILQWVVSQNVGVKGWLIIPSFSQIKCFATLEACRPIDRIKSSHVLKVCCVVAMRTSYYHLTNANLCLRCHVVSWDYFEKQNVEK